MSIRSLLSSSLFFATAAFLTGCAPLSPAAATHSWPTHGNQYYNNQDAKYLGSDSAGELSYRLIDSANFAAICQNEALDDPLTIQLLLDNSLPITIDNTRIQADLQWVKDSSVFAGREYQIYLFIDRTTGLISSVHGEPGTNRHSYPYIQSDRNRRTVSPIPTDSPLNSDRILIGQVHGHPALRGGVTLQRMSPDDSLAAALLQTPIYAIDAMDGLPGTPGFIHRANPNPGKDFNAQDLRIGKTRGITSAEAGSAFNIGLNALHIWGISHPPNFEELRKIDSTNAAIPNTIARRR